VSIQILLPLKKVIIIGLLVIAAVFWGFGLYLDGFYYENAPREPVLAEGRIHPEVIHHGTHVFLTERELFKFNVLFPSISIGSVMIAGLLSMRWKLFGFTKDFKGVDFFSWFRKNKKT
jgi:hypothetical protein